LDVSKLKLSASVMDNDIEVIFEVVKQDFSVYSVVNQSFA